MRLIDADKLKQHFAWWHEGGEEADRQAEIFEQIIDVQPTVSIEQLKWERDTAIQQLRELGYDLGQKPKKGKWEGFNADKDGWKGTDGSPIFMSCSFCGGTRLNNGSSHWNFCPNCGARMEVDDARDL